MRKLLYFLLLLLSCEKSRNVEVKSADSNFFRPGTFSADVNIDSIVSANFSEKLRKGGEKPLLNVHPNKTIRITVASNFFNSYGIRLEKSDSMIVVAFFLNGDRKSQRVGLSDLKLRYETNHAIMEKRWEDIQAMIQGSGFNPGFDNMDNAIDGVLTLIEYCNGDTCVTSFRHSSGQYYKNTEATKLLDEIYEVIPEGFVVRDLQSVKTMDDFLFSTLKKKVKVNIKTD